MYKKLYIHITIRGPVGAPPPALFFCPLLKISCPYLKILDLAKLFVAGAPIRKKNSFTPSQITLKYGYKNKTKTSLSKTTTTVLAIFSAYLHILDRKRGGLV